MFKNEPTNIPVEAIIFNELDILFKHMKDKYGIVIQSVDFDYANNNSINEKNNYLLRNIKITSFKSTSY